MPAGQPFTLGWAFEDGRTTAGAAGDWGGLGLLLGHALSKKQNPLCAWCVLLPSGHGLGHPALAVLWGHSVPRNPRSRRASSSGQAAVPVMIVSPRAPGRLCGRAVHRRVHHIVSRRRDGAWWLGRRPGWRAAALACGGFVGTEKSWATGRGGHVRGHFSFLVGRSPDHHHASRLLGEHGANAALGLDVRHDDRALWQLL